MIVAVDATLPKDVGAFLLLLHRSGVYQDGEYTGNLVTLSARLRAPESGLFAAERELLMERDRMAEVLERAAVYGYAVRLPAVCRYQETEPTWRVFDLFDPAVTRDRRAPAIAPVGVAGNFITCYFTTAEELHRFEGWLRGQLAERPAIRDSVGALTAHVSP